MRFLPFSLVLTCLCLSLAGCLGGGTAATDPEAGQTAVSRQSTATREVAIGMNGAQVTQQLGAASSTGTDRQGRETWIYERSRANFVYSANRNNRQVMVVDGYGSEGAAATRIVITFDQAGRVVDFSYQQLAF